MVGIAERTGLLGAFNFHVLNAALREASLWREAGIAPRLAVNLSPAMLADRELPAVLDQSLKTWGGAAGGLTLEIAENAAIGDAERSGAVLTRIKALNVALAIDDFGSGYTSLGQLRRMPVDEIKIDRPFIARFLEDEADLAVVRSAIAIAHNFGLRVIAEGVETRAAREALKGLGCDAIQGTVECPPLPATALRDWWTRRGA
jgi:EAL domain-containing protein (putative c-di-GMP-specific phosphodiesterase class I)